MSLFDSELEGSSSAALNEPLTRVRMTIAYDGTTFHGFAAQPKVRTVAGELSGAIERVLGHRIDITCAGRTDSGVHACGQVIHFDTPIGAPDVERIARSVNKMIGPAVVVRSAEIVDEKFHARFSAKTRAYRYTILNRSVPDPFRAATSWHVEEPVDLRAMQLGSDPLIGEHDFSSFCHRATEAETLRRAVHDARWRDLGDGVLRFDIRASSFCHQMVRSVVGTLVEMGMARMPAGDMAAIIRGRDRKFAGPPAPPHGLCLWEVTY